MIAKNSQLTARLPCLACASAVHTLTATRCGKMRIHQGPAVVKLNSHIALLPNSMTDFCGYYSFCWSQKACMVWSTGTSLGSSIAHFRSRGCKLDFRFHRIRFALQSSALETWSEIQARYRIA